MNKRELLELIEEYASGVDVELSINGEDYDISQVDFVKSNFFSLKNNKMSVVTIKLVADPT